MFAHEKLPGLPRQRLLDAIEPVLRAHGLAGVEIVWRTDGQGRVLYLTVESANAADPGLASGAESAGAESAGAESAGAESAGAESAGAAGVTLEVCSRVSRDLSTAFDVLELFDGNYRLEVGSPGLERRLYTLGDYRRFQGKLAKLKLASPVAGQAVITGKLAGVDAEGRVLLASNDAPKAEPASTEVSSAGASSRGASSTGAPDAGTSARAIAFDQIRSAQLVVDWREMGFSPMPRQRAGRRSAAQGRK